MAQQSVTQGTKFYDKATGKEFTAGAIQDIGGGQQGQFISDAFSLTAPTFNESNPQQATSPFSSLPSNFNTPTEIDAGSIGTPTLTVPTGTGSANDDLGAFVSSLSNMFGVTPGETARLAGEETRLTETLTGALEKSGTRGARQLEEEQKAGIPELSTQLADIESEALQIQSQFLQENERFEQEAIARPFIVGKQAAARRQQAVELGALSLRSMALQGKVNAAQNIANRVIDLEFADVQNQIDSTLTLLQLNESKFTRAEAKQARVIEAALQERSRIIEEQKQERQSNVDLMLAIAQNGGNIGNFDITKSLEDNIIQFGKELAPKDSPIGIIDLFKIAAGSPDPKKAWDFLMTHSGLGVADDGGNVGIPSGSEPLGWTGTISGYGSDKWENGLDFVLEGGNGADVRLPFAVEVIESGQNGGFGNQVKVKVLEGALTGKEIWLSHLKDKSIVGQGTYMAGASLGKQGNTGNVYSTTGGDGTHIDITMPKGSGSYYTPQEVSQMLGFQTTSDAIDNPFPNTPLLDPKQRFDAELKLAGDFEKFAGEARTAVSQLDRIKKSAEKAQSDIKEGKSINASSQGVLVSFQKLLDPTSVVRESEYARSGQGLDLIGRLEGKAQQIVAGGAGVSAKDLNEFVELGEIFYNGYLEQMTNFALRTRTQANNAGLQLENILTPDVLDLLERLDSGLPLVESSSDINQSTQLTGTESNNDPLGIL